MNKKEVAELKRRFRKKDDLSISRMAGCYVDANHEKLCKINLPFLSLEDSEMEKYLAIANKVLSGTVDNNLLTLEFPQAEEEQGGRQQMLLALKDSALENEDLLDQYYDLIIDTYFQETNYLILMFFDRYDVLSRTRDQLDLDESEEVFSYILCALCPVSLSKPGLSYVAEEQRFANAPQDWIVGVPDTGFLFPAFNDRSTDIHSCLFYTKNTKEPHTEFMTNGLGCDAKRTATEHKMAFHSVVRNVLGPEDDRTEELLLDLQSSLSYMAEEYTAGMGEDAAPLLLDAATMDQLLKNSPITEDQARQITHDLDEAFGGEEPPADHVIDNKALAANVVRLEKVALEHEVRNLSQELGEKDFQISAKDGQLADKDTQLAMKDSELKEKQEEIDSYIAETKKYTVVLKMKPEKVSQVATAVIDGRKCLVIPMDEDDSASINGISLQ